MKKTETHRIPVNETPEQRQARYARYKQEEIDKANWLKTDPDSIISSKEGTMRYEESGIAFDRELLSMDIDESRSHLSKELKTLSKWNQYEGPVDHGLEFEDGIYAGMCATADPLWVRIKKNEWVVLDQNRDEEYQKTLSYHIYLTHEGWEIAF